MLTMTPSRWLIMGASTARMQRNALSSVPSSTVRQRSMSSSPATPSRPVAICSMGAALFTSTSMRPKCSSVNATKPSTAASTVTSAAQNLAVPPSARIAFATASPSSTARPETTTVAPSAASRSARARPVPRVDPVTTATDPCIRTRGSQSFPQSSYPRPSRYGKRSAHLGRRSNEPGVSMSEPTTLLLEREGAVQWIRLNRPDARNGIDGVMREALISVFTDADFDPEVRAIVVTGQGRDFCTGADLSGAGSAEVARQIRNLFDYTRGAARYQELFQTYWELETPVVSAVNGTTAGAGWMLALLADLVVAAEGARWVHVFSRRGMVPHAGDPFFLPRVLPFHKLMELAMLSDNLTSETLNEWGAVNRLVPADEVEKVAREL